MGNITEIRENGELYAKYTYDTIGRLVREDNKKLGKTAVFTYDTNGNILCRKEYAFTLFETEKLDELDCDTFTYTYDGDKLLSYNGEECTYDAIGNPEKYRGLDADFDNGRQLKQLGDTTFTYDNLGRRISKKIPKDDGTTETITFTYDANGNLIRQSNGISFIYDASGVCGICYGNSTYFYRKDILGNIVALLNADGEIVAKYTYDAWGKCQTIVVDSTANTIANLNPFRYRSYYYDVETGLYFLKTRYYDPETGRFTTIDDISYLDPESINGLNLYAYCRNNPVMCVDHTGHMPEWLLIVLKCVAVVAAVAISVITVGWRAALLGIGISVASTLIGDWIDDGKINSGLDAYLGAIAGGAIGALGGGLITTMLASGAGTVVSGIISESITNFGDIFKQFLSGAIISGISYGLSKGLMKSLAKTKLDKIVGNWNKENIEINKKLFEADYGCLKIGRDGYLGVLAGVYSGGGYELSADILSYTYDFVTGLFF